MMEKTFNAELQERTREYLATSGVSQAKLAQKLGMNGSTTLSRWLSSSYSGDVEKIERALEEFFRVESATDAAKEKAAPTAPPVIMFQPVSVKMCMRASNTASCIGV